MFEFPEPPVPFALPYPAPRLHWAIDVVGWSKNYFGVRLDIDHGSLRQMLNGKREIPTVVAIWIETKAQVELATSRPLNWRERPVKSAPTDDSEDDRPVGIFLDKEPL